MNFYFLLEDEKSLLKTLPRWFEYMDFGCARVADIQEVQENNYVLQSGQGVDQLVTKVLFETIETLLRHPGKIDKLVIILDAEELEAEERKRQVNQKIAQRYGRNRLGFDIEIFVCNHCFETWLLGRCGLYPGKAPASNHDFYPYYIHYNIEKFDPEYMLPPESSRESIAKYHFHYLHELLRYKKIRYSKSRVSNVATKEYFEGIIRRIETTDHLRSFKTFYDFILRMKEK